MSLKKGRVYAGTAVHFHCNCSLTESQKMFFFLLLLRCLPLEVQIYLQVLYLRGN